MILADENLNARFVEDLRSAGHEVLSVAEKFWGISDRKVVELALDEKAILITEDKDFGELVFAHRIAKLTIVFLRYSRPELELMRRLLHQAIIDYGQREGSFFITIARGRVRVTEL